MKRYTVTYLRDNGSTVSTMVSAYSESEAVEKAKLTTAHFKSLISVRAH